MPEQQPLTPTERKLCRGLLVLAGAGVAVLGYYVELAADVIHGFVSYWVRQVWPALLAGKLPRLDLVEVFVASLVSGALGALFLISQYLAQLVGWSRCLRLTTLWFWTMVFGLFNAALASTVLPVVMAPGFGFLLIATGFICLRFGGQAWRIRRKEEKAAEADA